MSRGPGRVQRGIVNALAGARTTEPWPPYLTLTGVARQVYETTEVSAAQREAVRRGLRTMSGVDVEPWRFGRRTELVARLEPTPAERTLSHLCGVRQLIDDPGGARWEPPPGPYVPPSPERVRQGFERWCGVAAAGTGPQGATDVPGALSLLNAHCGSAYTLDDVRRMRDEHRAKVNKAFASFGR
ncbi:hypothetical protein ABZW02_20305 [Streptomyces sp. NPDC005180]|uniref:hypothetical protein n=1 Tax=Streptomyces sp. NPDC005180 TaxID=3156868 RepID=UPI0033B68210